LRLNHSSTHVTREIYTDVTPSDAERRSRTSRSARLRPRIPVAISRRATSAAAPLAAITELMWASVQSSISIWRSSATISLRARTLLQISVTGSRSVEFATTTYVDLFNDRHLHGEITNDASYTTPADAEADYHCQTTTAPEAVTRYFVVPRACQKSVMLDWLPCCKV
jgi:hypothetical protein